MPPSPSNFCRCLSCSLLFSSHTSLYLAMYFLASKWTMKRGMDTSMVIMAMLMGISEFRFDCGGSNTKLVIVTTIIEFCIPGKKTDIFAFFFSVRFFETPEKRLDNIVLCRQERIMINNHVFTSICIIISLGRGGSRIFSRGVFKKLSKILFFLSTFFQVEQSEFTSFPKALRTPCFGKNFAPQAKI